MGVVHGPQETLLCAENFVLWNDLVVVAVAGIDPSHQVLHDRLVLKLDVIKPSLDSQIVVIGARKVDDLVPVLVDVVSELLVIWVIQRFQKRDPLLGS